MAIVVRTLGISVAAALGSIALIIAGGESRGDANIGAGLIVFAVLVVGSFAWALVDGLRERTEFGGLALRWAVVAVAAPVLITLAISLVSRTSPDWVGRPEMFSLWFFLAGTSFVPAVVGAAIGYGSRSGSPASRRE